MPTAAGPRRLEVLVVDDDVDTLAAMQLLLQMPGVNVRAARSGSEALSLVKNSWPDVVLLDIAMPQVSGYDVAEALHHAECANEPMLVALTGYGEPATKRRCAEAGFDLHFTKPIEFDVVRELLWTLTQAHSLRERHLRVGAMYRAARIELLKSQVDMAGTLLDVAATTRSRDTKERCLAKARRSFAAIAKALHKDKAPQLSAQLVELQKRLERTALEESFDPPH